MIGRIISDLSPSQLGDLKTALEIIQIALSISWRIILMHEKDKLHLPVGIGYNLL